MGCYEGKAFGLAVRVAEGVRSRLLVTAKGTKGDNDPVTEEEVRDAAIGLGLLKYEDDCELTT